MSKSLTPWGPQAEAFFSCFCESNEHQIIVRLWDWGEGEDLDKLKPYAEQNVDLTFDIFLCNYSFWHRLWAGIKYVFGYKCKYGHFDNFNLKYGDITRMIDMLERYKSKVRCYQVKKELDNNFQEKLKKSLANVDTEIQTGDGI